MNDRISDRRGGAVCLVGNAPTDIDRSSMIENAQTVIRINDAFGFGGQNGSRTTHLFLINCGGQMREWLDEPDFLQRPHFRAADRILLPIHPDKDDRIDPPLTTMERLDPDHRNFAFEARSRFEQAGGTVMLVSADLYGQASEIIGYERLERTMDAPSTGLVALLWALERFESKIDVIGFGFDGWDGHRWSRERDFFEKKRDEGRIRLHPIDD